MGRLDVGLDTRRRLTQRTTTTRTEAEGFGPPVELVQKTPDVFADGGPSAAFAVRLATDAGRPADAERIQDALDAARK